MNDIWFTADTHLGHAKIIELTNRPFSSVEEMDEVIIANWNERVKKGDLVYHLGDFALMQKTTEEITAYIKRFNGQIHLIHGNHDHKRTRKAKGFATVNQLHRIKVGDQFIVLCHYAMKTWSGSHRGSWQLYGHSHGNLPEDLTKRHFDIGVDVWDFTPLSFDEVAKEMERHHFEPVDHHQEKLLGE